MQWTAVRKHVSSWLLAQLVEHCTGIAEVMGSNPIQAWIFFMITDKDNR